MPKMKEITIRRNDEGKGKFMDITVKNLDLSNEAEVDDLINNIKELSKQVKKQSS